MKIENKKQEFYLSFAVHRKINKRVGQSEIVQWKVLLYDKGERVLAGGAAGVYYHYSYTTKTRTKYTCIRYI